MGGRVRGLRWVRRVRSGTACSLTLLVALALAACDGPDAEQRATAIAGNDKALKIGIVWGDGPDGLLVEGAKLAAEEVNEAGGVLGRPLELVIVDSSDVLSSPRRLSRDIAHRLARHANMIAVIGHGNLRGALVASVVYEQKGILFVNPTVRSNVLNKHGFDYTFTTVPDNSRLGKQAAIFAYGLGYRRVAVLAARSDGAGETSKAFVNQAALLGVRIVDQTTFFSGRMNFRDILADLGAKQFDAVFVATDEEVADRLVRQSVEMNLDAPFLMSQPVNAGSLPRLASARDSLTTVPLIFNPYAERASVVAFREAFKTHFEREPDGWAALGYDAVQILVEAIEDADSPVPLSVAGVLRYTMSWRGLTGRYSFDRDGSIYTKVIDFATLENGRIRIFSAESGVGDYTDELNAAADAKSLPAAAASVAGAPASDS